MVCKSCGGTKKLYQISAKCSDMYSHNHIGGKSYDGYVPEFVGGGDYVEFTLCRHCGHVQGDWPHQNKASNQFKSGKATNG